MEQTKVKRSPGSGWKWFWVILLALLLAAAGLVYYVFRINQFSFFISLKGEPEIILEYGETFRDPGAEAVLAGSRFWQEGILPEEAVIQVHTDLREDTLGLYTVSYQADFYHWQTSAVRSVRVVDTQCPVITLLDTSDETILPGMNYVEEGYTAMDNYDGDITDRVKRTEEMGVITYTVMDSSGNPASVQREIPYYDPIAPEIHLKEGEHITIPAGTVFAEPGFTATDNADGDITERVTVEGEVLWYQPGTYRLTYTVSDVFGNETQAERTVEVAAVPRPDVIYPRGKVIYLTFDDGPGPYTDALLDVLARYGVKATFFVTDSGYDGLMRKIVKQGHSIGIHTVTHNYQQIYASPEAYFADLYGMQDIIYRNTGVKTFLLRFPGGGSNMVSAFIPGIMTLLTQAVEDAGFRYFDWNVDSMDAGGATTAAKVKENVLKGIQEHRLSAVLQHDIHAYSVNAVEDIILWGLENGYKFLPLKMDSPDFHHGVNN